MKKLFTVVAIVFPAIVWASHIIGAKIDYVALGNQKYQVTVTAYRDCNSTQLSNAQPSATCNTGSIKFSLVEIAVSDVTGIGPGCGVQSRCSGSYPFGIEEHVYQGVVDLSSLSCCEVKVSWEQCCSAQASTISTGNNNFYIEATINKCINPGSSIKWSDIRVPSLLRISQDQTLSFAASDKYDGDSISYLLVDPMSAAGTYLSFSGSFNAQRPVSFLGFPNTGLKTPGGFQFDSSTANITFRPTKKDEVAVITVEATEWRKISGTMTAIGKIQLQHQVTIIQATNNKIPVQTSPTNLTACTGDTSAVVIEFTDADTNDVFEINFTHNLKWAKASLLGSKSRKIVVQYLVDSIAPSGLLNAFTVEVMDNGCPVRGRSIKTYGFKNGGAKFVDSSYINKTVNCGKVSFKVNNRLSGSNYQYSWQVTGKNIFESKIADSITVAPRDTGWVKATLFVSSTINCNYFERTDSAYLSANDAVVVNAGNDVDVCNSGQVSLSGVAVYGAAPFSYSWSNGAKTMVNSFTPAPGINYHTITVTDNRGCTAIDTVKVSNHHPTISITGDDMVCKDDTANFTAAVTGGITIKHFYWTGFPIDSATVSQKLSVPKQYTFTVEDSLCTTTATWPVSISLPQLLLTYPQTACIGDSVALNALPSGGKPPYTISWDTYLKTGATIIIGTANATPGKVYFATSVTDVLGCQQTTPGNLQLNPSPVLTLSKLNPVCVSQGIINLSSIATPTGGSWTGNGVLGNDFNPSTAKKGLHKLDYSYTHPATGCSNSASAYIRVIPSPVIDFTADSTIVTKGSAVQFTNTTTADTTYTSKWVINGPKGQTTAFSQSLSNTFTDTGYYTVTLVINPAVCLTDSLTKNQYIKVNSPKTYGIQQVAGSPFKIYPNPATDRIYMDAGDEIITGVTITDITGKRLNTLWADNSMEVNTLAKGVYFIQVETQQGNLYHAKIVVE